MLESRFLKKIDFSPYELLVIDFRTFYISLSKLPKAQAVADIIFVQLCFVYLHYLPTKQMAL